MAELLRRSTDPRWVRLTRKLAQEIDGIDLTGRHVGDVLYLNPRDAAVLIAEGWAEPVTGDVAGVSHVSLTEHLPLRRVGD